MHTDSFKRSKDIVFVKVCKNLKRNGGGGKFFFGGGVLYEAKAQDNLQRFHFCDSFI